MPENGREFLQRPQAAQVQFNDSLARSEFTGQNKGQKPRISPGEADNRKTGLRTSEKKFEKKQNPKNLTCNPANWKLAEGGKTWTRINKVDKTKSEQGRQPKHGGRGESSRKGNNT